MHIHCASVHQKLLQSQPPSGPQNPTSHVSALPKLDLVSKWLVRTA